jgi:hypothetical protein
MLPERGAFFVFKRDKRFSLSKLQNKKESGIKCRA